MTVVFANGVVFPELCLLEIVAHQLLTTVGTSTWACIFGYTVVICLALAVIFCRAVVEAAVSVGQLMICTSFAPYLDDAGGDANSEEMNTNDCGHNDEE